MKRTFATVFCCTLLVSPVAVANPPAPAKIHGLVAWYNTDSLHERLGGGSAVERWEDSSGNGHDLVFTGKSRPPLFRTLQLNQESAVEILRENMFEVTEPFDLADHTIFIVYAIRTAERALFCSETDGTRGLVLNEGGRSHTYHVRHGESFRYSEPLELQKGYSITTLGRDSGVLLAFIDGTEVSSYADFDDSIRVGTFFRVELSKFVRRDGEGLSIAEMLFYDRYLAEADRAAVTSYLSERYGIAVADPPDGEALDEEQVRVRLGTDSAANVNKPTEAIEWTVPEKLEAPFRLDTEGGSTAIHCERDGVRARLSITLPLVTAVPHARIRMFILKNGESYHTQQAASSRFEGPPEEMRGLAELQATVKLDAGDFVEVITSRDGAAGKIHIDPDGARLVLTQLN